MSAEWDRLQRDIASYQQRAWYPAIAMYSSLGIALVVGLATKNPAAVVLLVFVGIVVAIALSTVGGVRCPRCHANIEHGTHGNPGALMLLVNLRQCPYCQAKF